MLRTWDLRGSVAFYADVLGFACESLSEEWGWASLRRDGVGIMLARPHAHMGETAPAFTGSLYIRTTDIDGWWQRLKERARGPDRRTAPSARERGHQVGVRCRQRRGRARGRAGPGRRVESGSSRMGVRGTESLRRARSRGQRVSAARGVGSRYLQQLGEALLSSILRSRAPSGHAARTTASSPAGGGSIARGGGASGGSG